MHKRLLLSGLALVAMASFSVGAFAQNPGQAEKRFDLTLQDADLQDATQSLALETGLNLQFVFKPSNEPYNRITLRLVGVTVDEALKYICEAAGAEFRKDPGGVYVIWRKSSGDPVTTPPSAGGEAPSPVPPPELFVKKITLRHADPKTVMDLLFAREVDTSGEMQALMRFRQLGAAAHITRRPDQPIIQTSPASFQPLSSVTRNAAVAASGGGDSGIVVPGGANQISPGGGRGGGLGQGGGGLGGGGFGGQFGGGGGLGGGFGQVNLQGGQGFVPDGITNIIFDPTDNSFIVRGTDSAIAQLERIIRQFDVAPKQVIIKVEFVTTTANDVRSFGIDWLFERGAVFLGNTPGTFARSGDPFFVNYSTGNLTSRLRAALVSGKGTLVSAPLVRTLNNQPAQVLQQLDFFLVLTQVVAIGDGRVITAPQLSEISIVTGLSVQPRINEDGTITLTVAPVVSDVAGFDTDPQTRITTPRILSQQIFVTARVKDGETIVVGGLIRKSENEAVIKYPILGDLPIIGTLFRSKEKTVDNQELLVLITPTIVREDTGGFGGP